MIAQDKGTCCADRAHEVTASQLRSLTAATGVEPCLPWQAAVAEFGRAFDGRPIPRPDVSVDAFEIGVIGLSGVGKSSLLNALLAPTLELLPSGGIGPLTGVPIRIRHEQMPSLRVTYRGGATRHWQRDSTTAAFLARIHEHISGSGAVGCDSLEVGWSSPLLETGLTVVDLPGLGIANDAYAQHTRAWLEQAKAVLVVTDRAGVADSVVTALRRSGFLTRVASGQADLICVVTKLDQVADDARRSDRSGSKWSTCFRSIVEQAESELLGQLTAILRYENPHRDADADARARDSFRVFGVSSLEHRRVVERDEEQRPRLHLAESSGVPSVRRALTALARLRSSIWMSELLDRVSSAPERATLLPELLSLVDTEGL